MRYALSFVALLLSLGACSGDGPTAPPPPPPPPSMSGAWTGTSGGITFTFTLNESSGSLVGSGNMSNGANAVALTVTGTSAHPSISMTWSAPGYQPINFQGTRSGNSVVGAMNGSGFVNSALTLNKQ